VPTGQEGQSSVRAVFAGSNFFAMRMTGHLVCTYYGDLSGNRVKGFDLCENRGTRQGFVLRFPPEPDRERRRWEESRRDEDFPSLEEYPRDGRGFDERFFERRRRP
jgi:hypothetical protein